MLLHLHVVFLSAKNDADGHLITWPAFQVIEQVQVEIHFAGILWLKGTHLDFEGHQTTISLITCETFSSDAAFPSLPQGVALGYIICRTLGAEIKISMKYFHPALKGRPKRVRLIKKCLMLPSRFTETRNAPQAGNLFRREVLHRKNSSVCLSRPWPLILSLFFRHPLRST
jgi:hypothetical protein